MKLKEFRKEVNKISKEFDNCEVILQIDSEGNGYNEVRGIDPECIKGEDLSEIYNGRDTAFDNCMEEDEWEKMKNDKKRRVIVVFP